MSTIDTTALPAEGDDLQLVLPGRGLPAGACMSWIGDGWRLFTRAPLMWIAGLLVFFVVAVIMNLVPILGGIAFQILSPVFAAGFVVACRSLERGGDFELEHLFAGFKTHFGKLAMVGLLFFVSWLVIMLIGAAFMGFGVIMAALGGEPERAAEMMSGSVLSLLLGMLIIMALMVPLLMFYWFAPALVVMHGMGPVAAMKASFGGCLRNILGYLVYGLVMTVLAVVAVIPFGLGLLAYIPLVITSTYVSYRQIFTEGGGGELATV